MIVGERSFRRLRLPVWINRMWSVNWSLGMLLGMSVGMNVLRLSVKIFRGMVLMWNNLREMFWLISRKRMMDLNGFGCL